MSKGEKKQRGFTLVEMMVAVAIFSTASVMVADLFLIANRSQRRAGVNQQIQSDARLIMSQLGDRIRNGQVDYAAYANGTTSSPATTLHLIDSLGNHVLVRQSDTVFSNTVCSTAQSTPCLEISQDNGTTFVPLTSANTKVTGVKFYVDPPQSPMTTNGSSGYLYNRQPHVTMVIGFQSTSNQAEDLGTTFLQTTVSSRVLLR